MRLINADECLDFLKSNCSEDMYLAVRAILDPCKTVEERKQGEWIETTIAICHGEVVPYSEVEGCEEPIEVCKCSCCGVISSSHETNFCPYCGADMRGNENG